VNCDRFGRKLSHWPSNRLRFSPGERQSTHTPFTRPLLLSLA
jgi:hypothetical protein